MGIEHPYTIHVYIAYPKSPKIRNAIKIYIRHYAIYYTYTCHMYIYCMFNKNTFISSEQRGFPILFCFPIENVKKLMRLFLPKRKQERKANENIYPPPVRALSNATLLNLTLYNHFCVFSFLLLRKRKQIYYA